MPKKRTKSKQLGSRFFVIAPLIVTGVFLTASLALMYWKLFPSAMDQFTVPLHYNVHSGVDRIGSWQQLFTVPVVGLAIMIINLVGAAIAWKRQKVLSYFLLATTAVCEIFVFLAVVFIVLLNLSYGI